MHHSGANVGGKRESGQKNGEKIGRREMAEKGVDGRQGEIRSGVEIFCKKTVKTR
jgi:hypothetical protein